METKSRYRNSFYLLAFTMFLLLYVMPTLAKAKSLTTIKEYSYQASEMDSKLSSRTIALEQVKRLLLEELGTFLISETTIKDFQLTKDQISSLTAGIVMTVILDEKWDGKTYFLKAKVTTDTDELVRSIDKVRRNQEQSKDLEEMMKKTEEALKRMEGLRKEMENAQGKKAGQENYSKAVKELQAIDWFKKGFVLRSTAKNNQEAMKAFDKAIEMDANYAQAYAGRAGIYNDWGQSQQALRESEQAIKLDPNLAWAFFCRGGARTNLRNYQEAIQDFNKAMELDPKYAWPYCGRSRTYYLLKNYQQALEDADKAIKLAPKYPRAYPHAYFHRGRALAALNNFPDAIKAFDKAIKLDPMFSGPFLYRGYTFLKLDKSKQALEDFKKAASLGNKEAQGYLKKKNIQ